MRLPVRAHPLNGPFCRMVEKRIDNSIRCRYKDFMCVRIARNATYNFNQTR